MIIGAAEGRRKKKVSYFKTPFAGGKVLTYAVVKGAQEEYLPRLSCKIHLNAGPMHDGVARN